jgi:homoserine kinase
MSGPGLVSGYRSARVPPGDSFCGVSRPSALVARAPASSANLGPGFDALALALALYVEVEVGPADHLTVTTTGFGSDLPTDATHLAARVAVAVAGHDRLAVRVAADIPVGRGLGSSAALAVAAAAAAGADDPLAHGVEIDGHPENAAASALGGLVAAAMVDGHAVARRLPLDPDLRFVVLVPDHALSTVAARAALPDQVPHADAAFNLGRSGLLVAGLADLRQLVPAATEDRLHQEQRAVLFPQASAILAGLRASGALGACWSGAGPTLLAMASVASVDAVRAAGERLLAEHGVAGRVRDLAPDLHGVTVQAAGGH